jgi:hypothetical protein
MRYTMPYLMAYCNLLEEFTVPKSPARPIRYNWKLSSPRSSPNQANPAPLLAIKSKMGVLSAGLRPVYPTEEPEKSLSIDNFQTETI